MSHQRVARLFVVVALLPGLSGCGGSTDNLPRVPVSGKVTVDGKPLPSGMISFNPVDESSGKDVVSVGAVIANGSYEIAREQGPIPGKYRVAIVASGAGDSVPTGGEAPGAPPKIKPGTKQKEQIPAKYNSKSELTEEIKSGSNSFNYDVKTS